MIKQQKDGFIRGIPKARIFPFCLGIAIFLMALIAGCSQNRGNENWGQVLFFDLIGDKGSSWPDH
jgi:hypothetical protein